MAEHQTHAEHQHTHGSSCGHSMIRHGDHHDYMHDGHLHRVHEDHVDECTLEVGADNPAACTPSHACSEHETSHTHATGCGHEAVPHGDHVDYLVHGHLHHAHSGHCDDHGVVRIS